MKRTGSARSGEKGRKQMIKINCCYAKFAAYDGPDPIYECRNPKSKNHRKTAMDRTCAGCKVREQLDPDYPAIIRREPEDRQITLEEYMKYAG